MKSLNVLLTLILAGFSSASFADNHSIISSDGTVPTPATVGSTLVERGSVIGTSTLLATGADTSPISKAEIAYLKTLHGYGNGIEPEAVWGLDTRVQVTPYTYPYRAITLIAANGLLCSGGLVGPDTVLTAGHCVHTGLNGSWIPVSSITVYPGAIGSSFPYGKCTVKRTYTTLGWGEKGLDNYDYGAIKLNCTVGSNTGWLGFAAPSKATGLPAVIAGYPGEKPQTQWASFNTIQQQTAEWLIYPNDTTGGQSGAPIWYDNGAGVIAFGVHTYKYPKANRGKLINAAVFKNIKTWKLAD